MAQAQYGALCGEYKITKTEIMSDVCNLLAVSTKAPNISSYTKNYANLSWESKYTPQSAQRGAHGFHIQRPGPQKSNQTIIYNYMLLEFLTKNATKFSVEEPCRNIIPACLKPRA